MPIIKWQPFQEQGKPHGDPNQFTREEEWVPFVPNFRMDEPALDISQDKKNLYIEMPLSGIKPENVEIVIEHNVLTLSGKIEEKKETKEKEYLRREVKKGNFRRSVKLPVPVKENKAQAESEMGVLIITIPKASKAESQVNKIPIKIK